MEDVIEISDSEREESSNNSDMEVEIQETMPDAEQIVPKDAATWVIPSPPFPFASASIELPLSTSQIMKRQMITTK